MKKKSIDLLKEYTGKNEVFFTDRGNSSILLALKLVKSLGGKKIFIQDQGGWLTYYQFIKKLKLEKNILETDSGLIRIKDLENYLDNSSVLLMNSMPGYHALQEDMDKIEKICKTKDSFLINDASGSIGRKQAKYGDVVLGSFGKWKPVEIGQGGYLAFNNKEYVKFFSENFEKEVNNFYDELFIKLKELPSKLKKIDEKTIVIKEQLNNFDIINRESKGLNVIVRFKNDEEKMKIIDFCKIYGYEYILCPMYIKVLDTAVSIEVMRLNF